MGEKNEQEEKIQGPSFLPKEEEHVSAPRQQKQR